MERETRAVFSADPQSHLVAADHIAFFIFDSHRKTATKRLTAFVDQDTAQIAQGSEMVINEANRLQWSLNIGAGIEYPVKKKQTVFVDFRFIFGHSNLVESNGSSDFDLFGYEDDLNVRFNQFVITAAYMFSYDWRLGLKGKSTIKKRKQY